MTQPEKTFRRGNCSASVFNNTFVVNGKATQKKNVVVQKSYKDRDGNWKNAGSFGETDLPKAILVLEKAYDYLTTKESPS